MNTERHIRLTAATAWRLGLAALVAGLHLLLMPAFFYPGDSDIPRAEAAWLINRGEFGLPTEAARGFGPQGAVRGQYWYVNDARGRLHSKSGPLHTLFYAPPLLIARLLGAPPAVLPETPELLLVLNIIQALLAAWLAVSLDRLAAHAGALRPAARAAFALTLLGATYVGFYLRQSTLEAFQLPVLAWFADAVLTARAAAGRARGRAALAAFMAASLLAGLRLAYAPLLIWGGVFALGGSEPTERRRRGLWCAGALAVLTALLAVNRFKFGAWGLTGYGQWVNAGGVAVDGFSVRHWPRALWAFLVAPGNANLWLHAPLLLPALCAWPGFWRRDRGAALFLAGIALATLLGAAAFSQWPGAPCYGPRYLLGAALLGAVPAARAFDWMLERRALGRLLALEVVFFLLLASAGLQLCVNLLHGYLWDYARGACERAEVASVNRYFDATWHRGLIARDVLYQRDDGPLWRPLADLRMSDDARAQFAADGAEAFIREFARINLWWAHPAPMRFPRRFLRLLRLPEDRATDGTGRPEDGGAQ